MLELCKSTYCTPFNRLVREVAAACEEANDNMRYLATLEPLLDKLSSPIVEQEAFRGLTDTFRPIVHLIMLVWKHSKYYNTAPRLVVLMREICNSLIMQVTPQFRNTRNGLFPPHNFAQRTTRVIVLAGTRVR